MRTQDVFTQMLREAVTARRFQLIVDHDYSNTGVYRAHVDLCPALQVHFSFQTDYATFTVDSDKGHEELPYVRFAELRGALDKILAHLPTPKMKKRARKRRACAGWRPASNRLVQLAAQIHAAEYASDEQNNAENTFTALAGQYMTAEQRAEWTEFSLKATVDERIDWALEVLGLSRENTSTSKE